jgi:hypothetical protein
MARIRQFAKDMGLSYNKAKRLVNKGRKLKDGGSSVLESTMNKAKMVKAEKGKITKIDPKGKNLDRAKMGQFNNIANAAREGKISPTEAQRRIQKLILAKQKGGGFDAEFEALQALNKEFEKARQKPEALKRKESLQKEIKKTKDKSTKSLLTRELKAGGKKGINRNLLKDKFLTDAELKKKYPERYKPAQPSGRTYPYPGDKNPGKPTQKPTMTREEQIEAIKPKKSKGPRVGANPKDLTIKGDPGPKGKFLKRMNKGGAAFPDLSGDGKVTKKDILIGRGVIKKSRGGGIAVQGTGFKGVY